MRLLEDAFVEGRSKEGALAEVVSRFDAIERANAHPRPKVALFGDLYARDNDILNQDLIHFVEAHGGEVITTPYTSYVKMVARPYYWKWFLEGRYLSVLSTSALMTALSWFERRYYCYFQKVLREPEPDYDISPQGILSEYGVRTEHTGESMDNLLKVFFIKRHYPDVVLFVQTSPAFCCPALVTEAMASEIERKTGVPVLSLTYDGTGGVKNSSLLPYLEYALDRSKSKRLSEPPMARQLGSA
jgi:predicted nucleotide-binding protein (sugar kinase/HSP70/actin superfamily)